MSLAANYWRSIEVKIIEYKAEKCFEIVESNVGSVRQALSAIMTISGNMQPSE
jgi:hypothetical protein